MLSDNVVSEVGEYRSLCGAAPKEPLRAMDGVSSGASGEEAISWSIANANPIEEEAAGRASEQFEFQTVSIPNKCCL